MSRNGDLTTAIHAMARALRKLGATVELYSLDLRENSGCYEDDRRWIGVNAPSAKDALELLAHEGGHHISYLRNPRIGARPVWYREKWAYLYGWAIIVRLKLDNVITRRAWRQSHIQSERGRKIERRHALWM